MCDSTEKMEFICVADDGWCFEAEGGEPFVPWGVNYSTQGTGWPPDMWSDEHFQPDKIKADFETMADLGVNVTKVVFPTERIVEVEDKQVELNQKTLDRFEVLREAAREHRIRLVVSVNDSWPDYPDWFKFESEESNRILAALWSRLATRFRDDPLIMGYSFAVEEDIHPWRELEGPWKEWLRHTYGSLKALNEAWGTSFAQFESIPVPAGSRGQNAENWWLYPEGTEQNTSLTNDPALYDFQRYRREIARRWILAQYEAVKQAAPRQLASFGMIQWSGFIRNLLEPVNEGPFGANPFDPHWIADGQDFMAPHFYPVLPPMGGQEFQLRYAQLWLRYCYVGKPVVLEEFNFIEDNATWCRRLVEATREDASGWMVWTFQNYPNTDNITEVCGLIDEERKLTEWGHLFREMAPEVKSWKLRRRPATRTVTLPERWLLTSGQYRRETDEIIRSTPLTEAIDIEIKQERAPE